ncbi:MAG TPA: GTP cyclohydrolase I [candidate division Zixibacteria bacterium]|nr:GTP cyclohydrolase I [candidate division Zixibacteria bacterium]
MSLALTNGHPHPREGELVPVVARHLTTEDRERFQGYLAEIFAALGMDLGTPGTADTPRRFLQAMLDATDGYEGDPKLITVFPSECHGGASCELAQIVEGPIPFYALCEHHALPFHGTAYVGYVAHEDIIGISKLTRLVRVLTRRFGVQERMTHQIATTLSDLLGAHGVAVYLEADHLCMQMRGVREDRASTRTSAFRGVYERDPALRGEFFAMAGIGRLNR